MSKQKVKQSRPYTRSQIEAEHMERLRGLGQTCEILAVSWLWEIKVWRVYYKQREEDRLHFYDALYMVKDIGNGPYLNGPLAEYLPAGCDTVEEEDALIRDENQRTLEEYRAKQRTEVSRE